MSTSLIHRFALGLTLILTNLAAAFADEKPIPIMPAVAREYKGKRVAVQFKVQATKNSVHRKTVFLDSEKDFRDEKNLGIAITEKGIQDLKQRRRINAPADHFLEKTIRVVGVVVLREDRPYIDVDEADQITEVKPSAE
jgi:hypothetical protein